MVCPPHQPHRICGVGGAAPVVLGTTPSWNECAVEREMLAKRPCNWPSGLILVALCSIFQAGAFRERPEHNFGRKPVPNRPKLKFGL